jgi:predicted Zn-dependent protease
VSADPQHREGRLRLALNLVRTGRRQAGEEILRALLDDGEQAWIEALAAQELVRNLIGDGRTAEAEREVRAALRRRPEDQRLWILLGAILDAEGRHAESVDTLHSLPPATRGVSPRARYAEWPELGFAASRQQLAAAAREGLPALGAALAEVRR